MNDSAAVPPAIAVTPGIPQMTVFNAKAVIQLNRPRQHNRFETADVLALTQLFDLVDKDLSIRALIITATGPTFSSGYDIGSLVSGSGTKKDENNHEFSALCDRLERLRVPTICAFNGNVYGGATDFALACDFRIGVEGMRMFMSASKLGLHYYYGGLRRFVERLGIGAAKHLFLTGEQIDAATMLRIGFVDEVVPVEAVQGRADELASVLAERAPLVVQGMKTSLNEIASGTAVPSAIQGRFLQSLLSKDVAEGLKAWAEKRKPNFIGE